MRKVEGSTPSFRTFFVILVTYSSYKFGEYFAVNEWILGKLQIIFYFMLKKQKLKIDKYMTNYQ